MKILELLRGRMAERTANNADIIAAAARKTAGGETVDHVALERAMFEERLTLDAFADLVRQAEQRQRWRAAMDRLPAATARRQKATAAIEKERAAFEAVHAAWMERAGELDAEFAAADAIVRAGEEARAQLTRPENVPGAVGEQLAAAVAELEEAERRVEGVGREQREWQQTLATRERMAADGQGLAAADNARLAKQAERRVAELAAELVTAQEAAAAAKKTVESLGEKSLKA